MTEIESLLSNIDKEVKSEFESRINVWIRHEFENKMLPSLLREVRERLKLELVSMVNAPDEIKLRLKFIKVETEEE